MAIEAQDDEGIDGSAWTSISRSAWPLLQLAADAGPGALGEAGAAEAAARHRGLLDALDVAIYTTDAAGRITFFNRAAARFWGRRPELGEEWCGSWRLYWPDGRPMRHAECPMAIALREDRAVRGGEAIVERPDGTRFCFMAYPTPLHDATGTMIGAVNVLVDITERRRAEAELERAAAALRASNTVKDEFLGLVSHELRTPVTTIFGNAQILLQRADRLDGQRARSMLRDIADDSERLRGIVENLLVLTRLEAGAEPDREPQVLGHVVRKVVEGFRHRHPRRPVSLAVDGADGLIVEADRTHLELLLENFLSNAVKYSPPSARVDVLVSRTEDEGRVLVLDRGIGVHDADVEHVFTPFYRSEGAKRQAGGMGIGLAVCRLVAETQGGRVWLEPREGGGTEAGFGLPLATSLDG